VSSSTDVKNIFQRFFSINGVKDEKSALGIEEKLCQLEEVKSAKVDFNKGILDLRFNSKNDTLRRTSKVIDDLGYRLSKQKKTFSVYGMSCAACVSRVEKRLKKVDGVLDARVNLASEKAEVETILVPEIENFRNALEPMGFVVSDEEESEDQKIEETKRELSIKLIGALIFASIMMIGNFFQLLSPLSMFLLAAPVQFWAGGQFYLGAWKALKHGSADMNSLVVLGSTSAFGLSVWAAFFSSNTFNTDQFSGIYFDSAVMIVTLILLGRFLESKAKAKASEAVKKLLNLRPEEVNIFEKNVEKVISLNDLKTGDTVCIRPGERFPADGVILEGSGYVDESMITGESLGVDKKRGDQIIGGSFNQTGFLKYTAGGLGENSILGRIVKMVEEAQGSKPPIQRFVDKVAGVFTPFILVIAGLTFGFWVTWGNDIAVLPMSENQFAWMTLVSVLVIACPCALGLATPAAIIVGAGKGAEHGVFIKGGEILEAIEGINMVVFDKTGTLTLGTPEIIDFWPASELNLSVEEIMTYAAGVEAGSNHPLAGAIKKEADCKGVLPVDCTDFKFLAGYGVRGIIEGKTVFLGNAKLMIKNGIDISSLNDRMAKCASEGKTSVFLARDKQVIGMISIADSVKLEAKELVWKLKEKGFRLAMITGDNSQTAKYIADSLGISEVYAEKLPDQKADIIKKLQQDDFKIAMVGDGINDAPALTQADIGIALGTGTDIAKETSDITLMSGDLNGVVKAFDLAKETMKTIRQNLFWAFFYNILAVPIAAGALFPIFGIALKPVYAAAAMSLSSVSVLGNSLLLNRFNLK
jgi:P-type Cu+ transporter